MKARMLFSLGVLFLAGNIPAAADAHVLSRSAKFAATLSAAKAARLSYKGARFLVRPVSYPVRHPLKTAKAVF
jgi:hypothetical protein